MTNGVSLKKMRLIEFILLYALANLVENFQIRKTFKNKFDKLRKKISRLLNQKKGSELLLAVTDLEYPGSNETLRQIHREEWLEYYDCLKKRYTETGPEKTVYPLVIAVLEGTSAQLKCDLCVSPLEQHEVESTEWYFNSSTNSTTTPEPVEYTEHTLVTPEDKTLNIYNVQLEQAGEYWCSQGDSKAAPFFFHVANESEPTTMIRPDEAPNAAHATPPLIIPEYSLRVYSLWTDWTPCSACDIVGKKVKFGYCTVSLVDESAHRYRSNESAPNPVQRDRREDTEAEIVSSGAEGDAEERKELASLVRTILPIFRNKLPCRSRYTPEEIQELPAVKNRKTEIMVRFCKIKCPRNIIFEVRDEKGKVLETANNSAGIYSMIQGMPEAPPTPTRVTVYEKLNKKFILKCPGNLNTDTPVVWQRGNRVVNPLIIAEQTNNRIYINMNSHMIIRKLRFGDASLYSCWQNQELAGTIRLEVTQELELKFDHHVVMIGSIVIVSVFLMVFWRAFKGRKRITIH